MAGWHHGLEGRESEWTLGDGDGQGGLACCDSWGHKELDTTERLNWTELNLAHQVLKGAPWIRFYSIAPHIRCLMGHALYCFSCWCWRVGRWWLHPLQMTAESPSSMVSWLSFAIISLHSLLPHIPLVHLSTVNSSSHPGIAPQSLSSSPSWWTF